MLEALCTCFICLEKKIESKDSMERDLEFEFPDHPYEYCFSE